MNQTEPFHVHLTDLSTGIGDLLMTLCAVRALASRGNRVTMSTVPHFMQIALASPHLFGVNYRRMPDEIFLASWTQLQPKHQIDAVLEKCGITDVDPNTKSLDLTIPDVMSEQIASLYPTGAVVVNPSKGWPARSWPAGKWQELVDRLVNSGIAVVAIGQTQWYGKDMVHQLYGVTEAYDLNVFETISLLRQSAVLVSTDTGPIQMAGATGCGIVGLYSAVAPQWRLPLRQGVLGWNSVAIMPSCPHSPCYQRMCDQGKADWSEQMKQTLASGVPLGDAVANWCEHAQKFMCMESIGVEQVFSATMGSYTLNHHILGDTE